MFDTLSDRLGSVFDRLRGRGALTEADVRSAMREVRVALLEADVALPVARDFVDQYPTIIRALRDYLADDIGEKTDLAAKQPEKVKELQTAWDEWNKKNVAPRWGAGKKE